MKPRDMRNHVGKRILLAMRDIDKRVAQRSGVKVCILRVVFRRFPVMLNHLQVGVDPCRFCGIDGCIDQLTK